MREGPISIHEGEDLHHKLFHCVYLDPTTGKALLAGAGTGTHVINDYADGECTLPIMGEAEVKLGAGVAAGARLVSDSDGHAIAGSGGESIGKALEAGDTDQVIHYQVEAQSGAPLLVLVAGADLRTKQYYITKFSGGKLILATAGTGFAAVQNAPNLNEAALVPAPNGKVILGATLTAGDRFTADSDGKAAAVTDHTHIENTAAEYAQNATTAAATVVESPGILVEGGNANDVVAYFAAPARI
jgi:hypothetical protein